ncbi:MAG: GNAT family N-acetyltransferase [Anaerolineae bacterium]|nr:GNAT family N-acetyltransferase [Anaerolineae bacterium]
MACRVTAGGVELRPLAEAVGAAEQVIDDYVWAGAAVWGEDLAATVGPLRRAIRLGRMDGWVACRGDQGLGLVVYLERARSGRLSFVHLLSDCSEEGLAARLVNHIVTRLRAAGFRHITSQAGLLAHQEAIHQAYLGLGFRGIERMIMSVTLTKGLCSSPCGYEMGVWDDCYLERAAQLFHDANRDTVDALIYPQFRTLEETERMVQAVRDGGAGAFVKDASGIVLHGRVLCGAIMLVRPEPDQGFIVVVAVAPAYQGRGVGRALLSRTLASAWEAGIRTVELTVTEENRSAVALYRRLGFCSKRRMTAYVWEATS